VSDFVVALLVAFGVVFVAELADKTQLLALSFGARARLSSVVLGLFAGYGAANALAAIVGSIGGARLPERSLQIAGGLLFLVFAWVTWRRRAADHDHRAAPALRPGRVVPSIALTIAVAEFGDKTQLATATLASQSAAVAVWIGATSGATASGLLGALLGRVAGDRLPAETIAVASSVLFAIFGVLMLAGAF
jgi:putative Ca2+/H+ antiporter (TMEM165/GDT1 family)